MVSNVTIKCSMDVEHLLDMLRGNKTLNNVDYMVKEEINDELERYLVAHKNATLLHIITVDYVDSADGFFDVILTCSVEYKEQTLEQDLCDHQLNILYDELTEINEARADVLYKIEGLKNDGI